MRGRWWRFEAVFVNREGPNYSTKLYARNITDNLPEQLIWDWEASRAKDTEPPGRIDNFSANN